MAKRMIQEINAGSMADIAFLLLIFFLVTTTMDTDLGITRKLPPVIDIPPPEVHKRNTLIVLVNRDNNIMVQNENIQLADIRVITRGFILNVNDDKSLPERKEKDFPVIGIKKVTSNHVISLQSDRGTSYGTFIAVQNELVSAYGELRNELAIAEWGKTYDELDPDIKKIVENIYPVKISEAEPVQVASIN